MSFSSTVKEELARVHDEKRCCRRAELYGLIRACGSLMVYGRRYGISVTTENASVGRRIYSLFKELYDAEMEVMIRRKPRLRKNNVYIVMVIDTGNLSTILEDMGLLSPDGHQRSSAVNRQVVRSNCCVRTFMRGIFMGAGSVTDPHRNYHLEIVVDSDEFAMEIVRQMHRIHIEAKISLRKKEHVVYVKEGDSIADFLATIGAHQAVFEFENIRIIKGMKNQVNRIVNCETANLGKTVDASVKQLDDIHLIEKYIGMSHIPVELRYIAELRIENPEMSLKEIGQLASPPIGKSGVNHRMRRIAELAEKFRPLT